MKITKISVYAIPLAFRGGGFTYSNGRTIASADSTIVRIETDEGITGYGEVCPADRAHLSVTPEEIREHLEVLAPGLLGIDPTKTGLVNEQMDRLIPASPFAKSPLDIACWDITGQVAGKPIFELLGGRLMESVTAHAAIGNGSVESTLQALEDCRKQGYVHFQVKVGVSLEKDVDRLRAVARTLKANEVLFADANGSWNPEQAEFAVSALAELPVRFEQPCARYDECEALSKKINRRFKLDESIDGIESLVRAGTEHVADAVSLKLCRHGGLSGSRTIRDIAEKLGLALNIEDVFGSRIVSTAIAHLAVSTRPGILINATHYDLYFSTELASGGAWILEGQIGLDEKPGLGLTIDDHVLGDPIVEVG